ncbi:MAG: hypothetical protein ABJC79_09935 [Acidimicrobiia bacterium]
MRVRAWQRCGVALAATFVAAGCATIDRVNTTASGGQSASGATAVAVSGSGRYVAFQSAATDLFSFDWNGQQHVYRKDRATGTIVDVDRNASGLIATAATLGAISDDGNLVAFITATSLVPADTNGLRDVYVRNVSAGTTVLGSVLPDGSILPPAATNGGVLSVAFDAGGHLFFDAGSGSSSVPGSFGFLRDLGAGTTTLVLNQGFHERVYVSRDGHHLAYNFNCGTPRVCQHNAGFVDLTAPYPHAPTLCDGAAVAGISNDGRYVLVDRAPGSFTCSNPAIPGRYDRMTGTWLDLGVPTPGASTMHAAGLSGDGRFVLLVGDDAALSGGTSGHQGGFVLDTVTGWSSRVTADTVDAAANASASATDRYEISADGRTVAFTSVATNLVPGDTNGRADAFARATPRPRVADCAPSAVFQGTNHVKIAIDGAEFLAGARATVSGTGVTVNSATPSADGRTLTLDVSVATDAEPFTSRDVTVRNVGGFGFADGFRPHCLEVLT